MNDSFVGIFPEYIFDYTAGELEELHFKSELPITTKANSDFHGYGLKSLRHAVHKYGGEVDISLQGGWFSLKILIPCPRMLAAES